MVEQWPILCPNKTDFGGVPPIHTQKETATKFQRTGGAETQPRPCLTPGGMEVAIPSKAAKNGHHHAPKPVASPGIDINHNSGERWLQPRLCLTPENDHEGEWPNPLWVENGGELATPIPQKPYSTGPTQTWPPDIQGSADCSHGEKPNPWRSELWGRMDNTMNNKVPSEDWVMVENVLHHETN